MQENPLLKTSSIGVNDFPPQTVSKKEKEKPEWYEKMMDNFEAIARIQYQENYLLDENCRMAKGEFIRSHYEEGEQETIDLIEDIQKVYKTPKKLQHFDLIQPIIETLLGEFDTHPDTFRVVAKGEQVSNERNRQSAELLMEYVNEQIQKEVEAKIVKSGLDPDKKDFASQEEQQQYTQQLQQARQAMTPADIKYYIDNNWQHISEKWANIQLEDDKERYDMLMKARNEFEYYLKTGKAARHFYLTATGFNQETWNYKQVFYQKSEDIMYPENGNYIGRITLMSLSDVIDKYNQVLTQEDLDKLDKHKDEKASKDGYIKDWFGNDVKYTSVEGGMPYGSRIPTNNDYLLKVIPQFKDMTSMYSYNNIFQKGYINNLYQVTEAYWKSQKEIGRLRWINPETGEDEIILVDETFEKPSYIKKIKGTLFNKNPELNTLETTYINVIYQGKKISCLGQSVVDSIYFDVKECSFQGKSEFNIYEPSFPVIMISEDIPLVSKIKPFQIFHNLFLNQLRLMAEEEILPFLAFDVNTIVKDKDWGGEEGFFKYMEAIKSLRLAPMDTRPHITNGANSGGQLPAVINLDITSRMQTRFELAAAVKQMAQEQVGFNPQRLAQIKASETATGINQAVSSSYAQTSSIFTKFYNYIKRVYQADLNFAQYTQSKQLDFTVMATKSDRTQAWLKLSGADLLLADLHVYVTNTQEEIRKLEFVKKMAIENNTIMTKMSDRIEMGTTNSIETIKELLKVSESEYEKQQAQTQDIEREKIASSEKLAKENQAFLAEEKRKDRVSNEKREYIRTFGNAKDNMGDSNSDGEPDIMEYNKFLQKTENDSSKMGLMQDKQELEAKKLEAGSQLAQSKMQQEDRNFLKQMELEQMKIKRATIAGDKSK